jgi:hypothetical protein
VQVVETKEATFLVLEYLGGGELFHYMQDKRCLSGSLSLSLSRSSSFAATDERAASDEQRTRRGAIGGRSCAPWPICTAPASPIAT